MTFEPGDKYIHFTKHGAINRGEVKWFGYINTIDTVNKVKYKSYYIVNTKGISLNLDGTDGQIYKIEGELTQETIDGWKGHIKNSQEWKEEIKRRIENK